VVALIQFHPYAQRILLTDPTERIPRTCPDAPNTKTYSSPLVQFQLTPNLIDMFLLEPNDCDPTCSGNLNGFGILLFGYISYPSKQIRGDHTAGDVRGDSVCFLVTLQNRAFFA